MQHTVRGILLLVALVAPAQAQPALNTCDGANNRLVEFNTACFECGNTCTTAISTIDDNTLSLMKTGFTACGNLPEGDGRKSAAVYATLMNYQYLISLATKCGLPASTVQVPPPAPNTCHGAWARYHELYYACPGNNTGPRTPATCGNDACKAAITSIDDSTLSSIKTGFNATGCGYAPTSFGYLDLYRLAVDFCGLPASTVQVPPPALNTCDGAWARLNTFSGACTFSGPYSPTTKCGNTSCATAISFFNDSTLSSIKTGFNAAGCSFASYATYFNYQDLKSWATQCGHPASTVKVTPPAGASLAWLLLLYKFI
jgi:hypothetical protein